MEKFKAMATSRLAVLLGSAALALLVAWPFVGDAQDKSGKAKDPDPHAQHKDKQPSGDQSLASQIAELHAKVEKLEATLKKTQKGTPSGTPDKGGLADKQDKTGGGPPAGRASAKFQNCIQCHQTRPRGPLPPSHLEKTGDKDMGTMEGGKAGTGATGMGMKDGDEMMKMMEMMQVKMKKMMEGKGMGMMNEKKKAGMGMMGMGTMDEKKKAGMGMMDMGKKKGMGVMEGEKTRIGGSTTGTMEQQMTQLMQLMQQMMEMKMKMMDKGIGTGADQTALDPHLDHTGTPPEKGGKAGVLEKTSDHSVDAVKDLPAQVGELQSRITNLEATLKTRP